MYELVLIAFSFLLLEATFTFGAVVLAFTHLPLLFLSFPFIFSCDGFLYPMASTSGASALSRSGVLRYALFSVDVYLCEYKGFLYTERILAMPSNGDAKTIYDARNRYDPDTALGAWSRCWAYWSGRGRVLQSDDIRYVDMTLVHYEEEYGYPSRLIAIIRQCYLLSADDLPPAGLYHVFWVQLFE